MLLRGGASKVEFKYSGDKLNLMQRIALCHIVLLS